jgi:hypothetical protein
MLNNNITLKVMADKELHEVLIGKMKSEFSSLPEGSLCQKTIRGKKYLYHYTYMKTNPHTKKRREKQTYLSKNNVKLKYALQRKAFIEKSLVTLEKNISAAKDFLAKYEPFNPAGIIERLPKAANDFSLDRNAECFVDIENFNAAKWDHTTKTTNTFHPENLIHNTASGLKVRSKSESIIATLLDMNAIPYHYEIPLMVGDHTFYPDFTVMRPSDKKIFYWEHFGMMDDHNYHEQMEKKLLMYINHGITPWDQLISTFESNEDAFDSQYINKIIKILLL